MTDPYPTLEADPDGVPMAGGKVVTCPKCGHPRFWRYILTFGPFTDIHACGNCNHLAHVTGANRGPVAVAK